ncbi:hypothetical protein [Photobacterium swingsii]|uniref:hypothetical protein n=1 Tax=Photobacterium swingsii TaxID=680026 RepID=UPI00406961F1
MNSPLDVLIADDDKEKTEELVRVLKSKLEIGVLDFSISYNSTAKKLKNSEYDLVLLDMSMPTFNPKSNKNKPTLKALAGKDIMVKLKYRAIKVPVIVVTQFDIFGRHSDAIGIEHLISDLRNNFPDNFVGCIYYNTQSNLWEKELIDMIDGVCNE